MKLQRLLCNIPCSVYDLEVKIPCFSYAPKNELRNRTELPPTPDSCVLFIISRYNPAPGQKLAPLTAGAEGGIESLLDIRVNRKELHDTTYVDGSAVSVENKDNIRNSNGFTSSTL